MTQHVDPAELKTESRVPGQAPDAAVEGGAEQKEPARTGVLGWAKRVGIVGAVALGCAWGGEYGWSYWTVGRFQVSTDDAYIQADSTIIAPKVSGYLSEVLVSDNEPVKAGQPLARIDDRDYAVALNQAKADLLGAQADVDNARATLDQQSAQIAQAQAAVLLDQANLAFAEEDNNRYATLAQHGAGTVQNAQSAITKRDTAKATLQRDQAALAGAEKQVSVLRAQFEKANASVAHSQAARDEAQLNLGYTTIASPVDGVVGNRSIRLGQYVQAGTQLLAVVPLEGVYVVANFKETQLTDVRAGQSVTVEVDTYPGQSLKGQLESISPAGGQVFALLPPDNATGNFTKVVQRVPVKIVFNDLGPLAGRLRPGMSVVPVIETRAAPETDAPRTAQAK